MRNPLPPGFRDRLPPEAEALAVLLRTVVDVAAAHGYQRVQPPLVEHEAELSVSLGGCGGHLLRAADPLTGAALALRPDITAQVARIAATRLASAPRPLRLAYGGPVVRGRGTQLEPARELVQAGAELVGSDGEAALREILSVAIEALTSAGVESLSVDLTLPDLVAELARTTWPVADVESVARALDAKDAGALLSLGAADYAILLEAAGPADSALARLDAAGPALAPALARLRPLVDALRGVRVTIDPTERHGFEYQSLGFSLFGTVAGQPLRGEIGRGGAYRVRHPARSPEPACGFSLYLDPLIDAGLGQAISRRVFVGAGASPEAAARLRADGWVTVAALSDQAPPAGCTHILDGDTPRPLGA
ncbi:MAG: ATP phosphoribosyltransferase regulatory subunit [Thermaurantiacus sp.]